MTPDDPRHGTYAGVMAHARAGIDECEPCTDARRRYARNLSYDHERGRRRRVSPVKAGEHIMRLRAAGLSVKEIAERAGVAQGTVNRASGKGYAQPPKMEATKLAAILSVPVPVEPGRTGYLPAIGVIRRVQALNAIGWQRDYIAARLGMSGPNLTQIVNGCRRSNERQPRPGTSVQASTWHKVSDLYDELCMKPGPSTLSRARAQGAGWPPPLAWDDIDDPAECPDMLTDVRDSGDVDPVVVERILAGDWRLPCTRAEKEAVVARWDGASNELARLTGWKVERYIAREETAA